MLQYPNLVSLTFEVDSWLWRWLGDIAILSSEDDDDIDDKADGWGGSNDYGGCDEEHKAEEQDKHDQGKNDDEECEKYNKLVDAHEVTIQQRYEMRELRQEAAKAICDDVAQMLAVLACTSLMGQKNQQF